MELKNQWKGWIYLLPALIVLAVFTVYPIFNTIILAFREGYDRVAIVGGATNYPWGFKNFTKILNPDGYYGELFYRALGNTTIIVFCTVIPSTLIALLIAVALNSIKPFQKLLQTIYFLPYITNTLAIAAVFQIIFQSSGQTGASVGILNNLIEACGGEAIDWLGGTNKPASMAVVCIYDIWSGLPFKILVLLGALQSVNKQCYDAAKIDGTPKRRVLWRITVPLISPMLSYLIITGFIGAFKEYTSIIGLFPAQGTKMGSGNFMITIVGLIYNFIDGDDVGQYGMASAAALVLLVIIMIFTAINMFVSKKKVHY
ncbi:MAG: sugar ABC transporter permease [Anaeroplasmataceae bacterium]|jgi:ABC-type sugar transport systems, permease components|nr:sugar ABC transporter permease [Anaeroplasmataceae bacterium]